MHRIVVVLSMLIAAPVGARETLSLERVRTPALPDCYCRAQGRIFAEGEEACLQTADGPRIAQCSMELNVMSWTVRQIPCPEA